jgi:hypothetical protein
MQRTGGSGNLCNSLAGPRRPLIGLTCPGAITTVMSHRAPIVEYATARVSPVQSPRRLVAGLLCCSVVPVLALLSLLTWIKSSPAVVGLMLLGFYVGLPCVALGFIILPRGSRGRVLKWAWLPLLVSLGVIVGLGSSAEIA